MDIMTVISFSPVYILSVFDKEARRNPLTHKSTHASFLRTLSLLLHSHDIQAHDTANQCDNDTLLECLYNVFRPVNMDTVTTP